MNIWKITFAKTAKDTIEELQYCLSHGIVAVSPPGGSVPLWEDMSLFQEFRNYPSELYAIFNQVQTDDLVWTRDQLGVYFLGRILDYSPHDFKDTDDTPESLTASCRWHRIGTMDSISQVIVDAFEPYRKFRLIGDEEANLYSRLVYNKLADIFQYPVPEIAGGDLFELFSADDCLDIVALYLQIFHGYKVIPSSFTNETGHFDFTISIGTDGLTGGVVVKTNSRKINMEDFESFHGPVYIFAPKTVIDGILSGNIHIITGDELQQFMIRNLLALPLRIGNWVRHYLQTVGFGELS